MTTDLTLPAFLSPVTGVNSLVGTLQQYVYKMYRVFVVQENIGVNKNKAKQAA
jgi:hypothetical protein